MGAPSTESTDVPVAHHADQQASTFTIAGLDATHRIPMRRPRLGAVPDNAGAVRAAVEVVRQAMHALGHVREPSDEAADLSVAWARTLDAVANGMRDLGMRAQHLNPATPLAHLVGPGRLSVKFFQPRSEPQPPKESDAERVAYALALYHSTEWAISYLRQTLPRSGAHVSAAELAALVWLASLAFDRCLGVCELRSLCTQYGDNDWDDAMPLDRVLDHHLFFHQRTR